MPTPHRTALVTGGNRGLGLETARQLAGDGLRVILTARDPADARAAAALLAAQGAAVEPLPVALDVANPASIAAAADHLRGAATSIDVLINNAGVSLHGFDADVARATLATNFFGPLRVTEACCP